MPTGTKKTKCKLLSEKIGLTTFNLGIDAMMADVLKPYKILTERLQTQITPIAHNVRKWISEMFKIMNRMFLGDDPSFDIHFNK